MKKNRWICLLLACALALSACGGDTREPDPDPGVITLTYAKISNNDVNHRLDLFNRTHKDIQIEVRDYTQLSEGGRQGVDLLMAEIIAGKAPDIIELGTSGETSLLSYRQLARSGYLEDLWPYIEKDPALGRRENGTLGGVMEAPLQASRVNGGLYAIFGYVQLHVLMGAKEVVGDRTSWTPEELLETFASMPEGSVILEDHQNWDDPSVKQHFLTSLLYGFSDLFIDWEEGQCFFDGEKFRSLLELTNQLPYQYDLKRSCANQFEARDEHIDRLRDGVVMLEDVGIGKLTFGPKKYEWYLGEPVYIGYPVDDGSPGTYFEPLGLKLAMSSACREKEAAWKYMRQMYYFPTDMRDQRKIHRLGLSVSKEEYRRDLRGAMDKQMGRIGTEIVEYPRWTKEDENWLQDLCNSTTRSSLLVDQELVDLVTEVAGAYFVGDKSLDEAVRLIQNRASLYVNEVR